MRLSEHFATELGDRLTDAQDGTIPEEYLGNARRLAMVQMEQVRTIVGPCRCTSLFRTRTGNATAGGVKNSQHQTGDAYDLVPLRMGLYQAMTLLVNAIGTVVNGEVFDPDQLIVGKGHIHGSQVQQPRRMCLVEHDDGSFSEWKP